MPYLLVIYGFACSPRASAQELVFVCENNGLSRSVEVVFGSGYACRVKYTKALGTSYPWSARREAGYCGSKALFLVDKLESWGWKCDSAEDVKSILAAQIERYHRHIRILANVGKTCHFYPAEAQYGDLCGDRRQEAVIVYTCEKGPDDWDQHLAVFLEIETEPLIREVGGSRSRQITAYHIADRKLWMEVQPFDTGDQAPPEQGSMICRTAAGSTWELDEE